MRTDFKPVHLQEANAKLDKHVLSPERYDKHHDILKDDKVKVSLWKKFVEVFRTNTSLSHDDKY